MSDKTKILDLLAFIDMSRRNIERALSAENFCSAAFIAEELSHEATVLAKICYKANARKGKS